MSLGSALPEDLRIDAEMPAAAIRSARPGQAGRDARAVLGERYWVHLDVDVLGDREFPAVDYPNEDGLTLGELAALLPPLVRSPGVAGFSLACYNPDKDPGGCARTLTELLGRVFAA